MLPSLAHPSPPQAPGRGRCRPLTSPGHLGGQHPAQPAVKPDDPGRSAAHGHSGGISKIDRPTRNCQHRLARHEHGTRLAYVSDRCRCPACTDANRLEAKRRRTAIAYGSWIGLVDAGPSRDHIGGLRGSGLSLQAIAALSGVGYGTVARIIYGDPARQQPPTARVRSETQRRLLQARPRDVELPGRRRVDATPTRRRLQALAALGWPPSTLAVQLGRTPGNVRRTLTTATVTATTARAVAALYEKLNNTQPPTHTHAEQTAAAKTRTQARLNGWVPPLAWDDIDTDPDDPDPFDELDHEHDQLDEIAIERAMNGDTVPLTRHEQDEAIARLTQRGLSARRIAELLKTSSRNIVRRRRAQRNAT